MRMSQVALTLCEFCSEIEIAYYVTHSCPSYGLLPLQVTQLFIGYVTSMLQQYGQNPDQNWRAKDCAIYLVLALTVRGKTAAQGATTTNQLVNILDFFNQHILPELQSPQMDQRPVIKADALKYLTLFRSQIPKDICVQVCHFVHGVAQIAAAVQARDSSYLDFDWTIALQVVQRLVTLMGSDSNVVHTYAAVAVERLLAQKVSQHKVLGYHSVLAFVSPKLSSCSMCTNNST